jgi:hypothetical protein
MGTWTMIKLIAALVVMFVVGGTVGGYIWNYQHRGKVIEEQKREIAEFKEKDRIRGEGKKVIASTLKKQAAIDAGVSYVDKSIDEMVPSGDRARALKLLDPYRVRRDANHADPSDGGGSGNRPAPGRPAPPGLNR